MAELDVNTGNLLLDLLFPRHAVDYVCNKDKTMLQARLLRETYKLVTSNTATAAGIPPPFLMTSGSRTMSMRLPIISEYTASEIKLRSLISDLDLMLMHQSVVIGDKVIQMEFIGCAEKENIGFGKLKVVGSHAKQSSTLFCTRNENGEEMKYINGAKVIDFLESCLDNHELKMMNEWQRTGPALERINLSDTTYANHMNKADIVITAISSKDYFKEKRAQVMDKSSWPIQVKQAVMSSPISFVQVSPKNCKDPDIMWRVSFSMQELIIGRSLGFHQHQIYMAIRYTIKYLTESTDIPENISFKTVSSYMIMNSFFAFCDRNSSKDWSMSKMETVVEFFRHFVSSLSSRSIKQYLLPENNLLHDIMPEWCQFYANLFSFSDETTLIKLLLKIQQSWRVVQFERCIQTHWAGEELTLEGATSMLEEITKDALVNLEPVRAVQALWNHFEINKSYLEGEKIDRGTTQLEFWRNKLCLIKELAITGKIPDVKYMSILKLILKMRPQDVNKLILGVIQKLIEESGAQLKLKIDAEPYYIAKYENHGEIDDCTIYYNDENVTVHFTHDKNMTYVFPYTDPSLLISETFLYFTVCHQVLQMVPYKEVERLVADLPNNVPDNMRDHPLVTLACVLRDFLCKKVSYPDFSEYKVDIPQ